MLLFIPHKVITMYHRKFIFIYGSVGELVIIMLFFFKTIRKAHLLSIISFDLFNSPVRLLGGKCPHFTPEELGLRGE